jgi:hypothetical protein
MEIPFIHGGKWLDALRYSMVSQGGFLQGPLWIHRPSNFEETANGFHEEIIHVRISPLQRVVKNHYTCSSLVELPHVNCVSLGYMPVFSVSIEDNGRKVFESIGSLRPSCAHFSSDIEPGIVQAIRQQLAAGYKFMRIPSMAGFTRKEQDPGASVGTQGNPQEKGTGDG